MTKKLVVSSLLMISALNASDVYGRLGVAQTSGVGNLDSGISVVGAVGTKMGNNLGLELEATQTVSHPSKSYSSYYYNYNLELKILNVGLYGVYDFLIPNTKIAIKPRIGLNYQHWTVDGSDSYYSASASDSKTGLSYGVGISYKFSDDMEAILDYVDKGDSTNLGLGVQMSF